MWTLTTRELENPLSQRFMYLHVAFVLGPFGLEIIKEQPILIIEELDYSHPTILLVKPLFFLVFFVLIVFFSFRYTLHFFFFLLLKLDVVLYHFFFQSFPYPTHKLKVF